MIKPLLKEESERQLSQIKSRKRVQDHGEVFTAEREVKAMCDLVKDETERIDSRFLEPACGDGNFLAEILKRKLAVVEKLYSKSISDWEKFSIQALTSLYGIDILQDNARICRERLFNIWLNEYQRLFDKKINLTEQDEIKKAATFILNRNILCGNALSLKEVDETQNDTDHPIIFSEWSFVSSNIKRRDFTFRELVNQEYMKDEGSLFSDLGDEAEIFSPIKEYPLINFRRVYEQSE
ncbi:MAG: hypothetical protein J5647_00840 [Spirochaetaceae bacterium]|nr:hypothetical protein [Spirochaetaceae bacterium]